MRTVIALVLACVMFGFSSTALAAEFEEGFESYVAGSQMHGQGGWHGWDGASSAGAPCSNAYANTGNNSVEIISTADLVHQFEVSGGQWVFSAMMYIPSGATGTTYFIMLNTYSDGGTQDWSVQIPIDLAAGTLSSYYVTGSSANIVYNQWVELKMVIDLDNNTVDEYYNGTLLATHTWDDGASGTFQCLDLYGNSASSVYYDDITLTDLGALATDPFPSDGDTDAACQTDLSWTAGSKAVTHDVYFGTDYETVAGASRANAMGVLVSQGQSEATYQIGATLEQSSVYYWRVDEIRQDGTIDKGQVWTFTTEPALYTVANVVATTNGALLDGQGPENTVNGSGLDANGQHSANTTDMWLTSVASDPIYIQFEFDQVYKLQGMNVWNHNFIFEMALGFGSKEVAVEYSADGAEWTAVGDIVLTQAPGTITYTGQMVDLPGIAAKFVRLTINSSYNATPVQVGLSEVRFYYTPTQARYPRPGDGATDVDVTTALNWRPGRDAVSHTVYLSTDQAAVTDGTASAQTTTQSTYAPGTFVLGNTYYWRVDEINEAEAVPTWAGDVWTFTTQEYKLIDGFESYDDDVEAGTAIWQTWIDSLDDTTNGHGVVGYDQSPFAELTTVFSGRQSMPLRYDNSTSPYYSKTYRAWTTAQDFSAYGATFLKLYVYGDPTNAAEKLSVTLEDATGKSATVTSDNDQLVLQASWQACALRLGDFTAAGVNLARIKKLTINLGSSTNPTVGGSGMILVDNLGFGSPLAVNTVTDVTGPGDTVVGVPNDGDWPTAEYPALAVDNKTSTKFLHFKGETQPTGIQITPAMGSTIVTELTLTTANDATERDPVTFELYGSNVSIDGPYTLIASGDIVDFAGTEAWPRYTKNATPITFDNDVVYTHYQLLFPTVRDASSANSMQIGEVELIGLLIP